MKKYELQTQNSLPLVANEGQGEVYQSTMVINKMEVNLDIMLLELELQQLVELSAVGLEQKQVQQLEWELEPFSSGLGLCLEL